jgi:glycosyltransferase involved in cell wall biosynthesis
VADGVNGVLARDDEALAAALARLVTDTDLRRRMARQNATVPPPQAWTAVVAMAEAEYRRAGAT